MRLPQHRRDFVRAAGRHRRRGRFLHQLLMPALDAALALAQDLHIAVLVRQHLKFDVPRRADELLQVDVGGTERAARFVLRLREQRRQVLGLGDDAHAASAAARRRLENHRIADLLRQFAAPLPATLSTPGEPGSTGTPISRMNARARSFTPISRITSGRGPMNFRPDVSQTSAKLGVLAQKSVARVNRVDVGDLGGADDRGDVQVAARALGRSDADRLVGKADVRAVAVGLGIDRHRLDAQFLASADDADCNFAAVGDEDLLKSVRMANRASPYSTGCPFITSLLSTMPLTSHSISFISFIDLDDAQDLAGLDAFARRGRTARRRATGLRRKCRRSEIFTSTRFGSGGLFRLSALRRRLRPAAAAQTRRAAWRGGIAAATRPRSPGRLANAARRMRTRFSPRCTSSSAIPVSDGQVDQFSDFIDCHQWNSLTDRECRVVPAFQRKTGPPGCAQDVSLFREQYDCRRPFPDRGPHVSGAAPHAEPGRGREPHPGHQLLHGPRHAGTERRPGAVAQPATGRDLLHRRGHRRDVPGRGAHHGPDRAGSLHPADRLSPAHQYRLHPDAHDLLLRSGGRRRPLAPGTGRHPAARRRRRPGAARRAPLRSVPKNPKA